MICKLGVLRLAENTMLNYNYLVTFSVLKRLFS